MRELVYSNSDGSWKETNSDEIRKLLALLIYTDLVNIPTYNRYWSTKSLYHGNLGKSFYVSR